MTTSDRLLGVLDLFDFDRPNWSVEEAAGALGLATSTTYRYFASLTASGLLAPFPPNRYVLGPTIIRYDRQIRLTDPLILAARDEMRGLAEVAPGRTVAFLCRLLGGQVMCVDQHASGSPAFALGYERGRLMPLYAGSASKVILAHVPPRRLRAVYDSESGAFAAVGLGKDWSEAKAKLRAIRTAGFLVTSAEVDPGMRGISVPVVDPANAIVASVNVAGPQSGLPPELVDKIVEALKSSALRIESKLPKL
jgi:DNA-binding IclR family transcriptional regulator